MAFGHFDAIGNFAAQSKIAVYRNPAVFTATAAVARFTRIALGDHDLAWGLQWCAVALRAGRLALDVDYADCLGEIGRFGMVEQFPGFCVVRRMLPSFKFR